MRIIAGERKGHTIHAPPGRDTRPTSDRVRENAFNLIGPVDEAVRAGRKYDLVLVDPPYTMTDYDTLARYLPLVLAEDGLLVFETDARAEPQLPLAVRTSRKYGGTRVTLFEHA